MKGASWVADALLGGEGWCGRLFPWPPGGAQAPGVVPGRGACRPRAAAGLFPSLCVTPLGLSCPPRCCRGICPDRYFQIGVFPIEAYGGHFFWFGAAIRHSPGGLGRYSIPLPPRRIAGQGIEGQRRGCLMGRGAWAEQV